MNRVWSLLFLCVPLGCIGVYVWAALGWAPLQAAWLPDNVSVQGRTIDSIFYLIHYLAAAILAGTGIVLAYCLWRFRDRQGTAAQFVRSNVRLEIIWTMIPAAILVWLALYQMNAWADAKMRWPQIEMDGRLQNRPPHARIVAKQFGWEIYYPGADGRLDTPDDVYVENELYVPVGTDVVLELKSRDVIHSFFVPQFRLKQDIVPGSTHHLWFRLEPSVGGRRVDMVCAELCGWGHYRMNGYVHLVSAEEFAAHVEQLASERHQPARAAD